MMPRAVGEQLWNSRDTQLQGVAEFQSQELSTTRPRESEAEADFVSAHEMGGCSPALRE
jgi:hypothetical protein